MLKRLFKKGIVTIALTLGMLVGAVTASSTVQAADTYTVVGTTYYLALRTAPAYDYYNEIGKLYNGQTVEVLSTGYNGYSYVYAPSLGMNGYVNSSYISYNGGYVNYNNNVNNNTSKSTGNYRTVHGTTYYLALRSAPAYDYYNEMGKLYNGQTVEVLSTGYNGYSYVYAPSLGMSGYVNSNYI